MEKGCKLMVIKEVESKLHFWRMCKIMKEKKTDEAVTINVIKIKMLVNVLINFSPTNWKFQRECYNCKCMQIWTIFDRARFASNRKVSVLENFFHLWFCCIWHIPIGCRCLSVLFRFRFFPYRFWQISHCKCWCSWQPLR